MARPVRVFWDMQTSPLLDSANERCYNFGDFRDAINCSLKTINPDLEAEGEIFAFGYPEALQYNNLSTTDLSSQGVTFISCPRRKHVCRRKSTCQEERKTGPELFVTLHDELMKHAVLRGPAVTLLISADVDFSQAVDYLRLQGSQILLAISPDSIRKSYRRRPFPDHGHYTWFWKNLRLGGKLPTFQCNDFTDIDRYIQPFY